MTAVETQAETAKRQLANMLDVYGTSIRSAKDTQAMTTQVLGPCVQKLVDKAKARGIEVLVGLVADVPGWIEELVRCQFTSNPSDAEVAQIQIATGDILKILFSCAPAAAIPLMKQDYLGAAIAFITCAVGKLDDSGGNGDTSGVEYDPNTDRRC